MVKYQKQEQQVWQGNTLITKAGHWRKPAVSQQHFSVNSEPCKPVEESLQRLPRSSLSPNQPADHNLPHTTHTIIDQFIPICGFIHLCSSQPPGRGLVHPD